MNSQKIRSFCPKESRKGQNPSFLHVEDSPEEKEIDRKPEVDLMKSKFRVDPVQILGQYKVNVLWQHAKIKVNNKIK